MTENSRSLASRAPWRRAPLRWAIRILGVIALLVLALTTLGPWWLQTRGLELASEVLGRTVSVDRVSISPWRLGLELHGLRVASAKSEDQAAPQLRIERLGLTLSPSSLWRGWTLSSVLIEGPEVRLARLGEQSLDIDDLLARLTAPRAPEAGAARPNLEIRGLSLREGRWLFDDRHQGTRHELKALNLDLPALSLRESDAVLPVTARVTGQLDGTAFDANVQAQPFAQPRQARLLVKFSGLDLKPWLPYVPLDLPLRPEQGLIDADLALDYAQPSEGPTELSLKGTLGARNVSLARQGESHWLAWQELRLSIKDLQPLRQQLQLESLQLTAPELRLRRDAAGRLLLPEGAKSTPSSGSGPAWQLGIERLSLSQGQLRWHDEALRPAGRLALEAVELEMSAVRWPLQPQPGQGADVKLTAALQSHSKSKPAVLQLAGRLGGDALAVNGQWDALALEALSPYLQATLPMSLQGRAAGRFELALPQPLQPQPLARLRLTLRDVGVQGLQAQHSPSGEVFARADRIQLDAARLDPGRRELSMGRLHLKAPALRVQRDAQGRLSLQALLPAPPLPATTAAAPWALSLAELLVDQGQALVLDESVRPLARPGAAAVHSVLAERFQLRLRDLAFGGAQAGKPSPVQLSLMIGRGEGRRDGATPGSLEWSGHLSLAPLAARGTLRAARLPLALLDPYLGPSLQLHLRRGEAGFRGSFSLDQTSKGWRSQAQGALLLADLRLFHAREIDGQRQAGEELLNWQSLELTGLDLALEPGAGPRVEIGRANLADFYARLVVDERGHFNLGDLRKPAEVPAEPLAEGGQAPPGATLALSVAETRLSNGRVDFSDRYIRPNYSAKLSELAGSLGRFASGSAEMAPLTITGRIEGTGLLQITGQLNPGARPLAMDIQASATDIELAPLSPYAGKYAGYAIERGKLSSRVHYRIDPSGQLQADNQLILNQLTFGERIESPSATKLPVLLAVALLKDSKGVIDVNLPISGSLNDPQFSMSGLIVRVIVNLIGKALIAPFSLLSGGGANDLSQTEFAPGSAAIEAAAAERLDKLAQALNDRPGLSLTITGWAQMDAERAALQAQALERALLAERRRELRRQQNAVARKQAEALNDVEQLSDADRERLLSQVYKASNLPNRPRNLLGMLKDILPAEMRAMLLASYEVKEEAVRQLALARAVALRDALIARKVPNERIFLASARLAEPDPDKPWVPRVELALTTH